MATGDKLDPVAWARAREILYGRDGNVVSERAAAQAAGVTVRELRAWVKRSREKRIEDEPWVHEISDEYDSAPMEQAGVLEDKLFEIAINGTKEDVFHQGEIVGTKKKDAPAVALKLLEARDRKYKPKAEAEIKVTMDMDEMISRIQAAARMKLAKQATKPAIESTAERLPSTKVESLQTDEIFLEE